MGDVATEDPKTARRERYVRKKKKPSLDWTCTLCGALNFGSKRRAVCFCGAKKGAAVSPSSKRVEKRRKHAEAGQRVNRSGAAKRKAKRSKSTPDGAAGEE
jgi:hypothetical protein